MKRYFRRVMSSALTVGMLFSSSCIMAHAEETPANPVYNAETSATKWDYVYFGRYPQKELVGDYLTNDIKNGNYNKFGDAIIANQRYKKYDHSKDDDEGTIKYYLYEPIKWRVLKNDGNNLMLISDKKIFQDRFFNYDYDSLTDEKYSTSLIRSYLNGLDSTQNEKNIDFSIRGNNFISTAFNDQERNELVVQDNGDLISIPNESQISNEAFGFDSIMDRASKTRAFDTTDFSENLGRVVDSGGVHYIASDDHIGVIADDGYSEFSSSFTCPIITIPVSSKNWSKSRPASTVIGKDVNAIGTDHCAFMKKEKNYPSLKGFPLGVGGVEHSFSIMYRRFGNEIINKMSKNTGILQDFPTKGELEVGKDADISIFQEIDDYFEKENHGTCDYSIYDGIIGAGEFKHVLVRGKFVLKDRKIIPHEGKEIICGE